MHSKNKMKNTRTVRQKGTTQYSHKRISRVKDGGQKKKEKKERKKCLETQARKKRKKLTARA